MAKMAKILDMDFLKLSNKDFISLQTRLLGENADEEEQRLRQLILQAYTDSVCKKHKITKVQSQDICADACTTLCDYIRKKKPKGKDVNLRSKLEDILVNKIKNMNKNFNLTQHEFERLRQKLKEGDETLIETIYLRHVPDCIKFLLKKYGNSHQAFEKARQSTMDALFEIREDLLVDKIQYGNLRYYFTARAKMKYSKFLNRGNDNMRMVSMEDQDFESDENISDDLIRREIRMRVVKAMAKLCEDCKNIIRLHYYEEHTFKKIAELLNITYTNATKKAERCRKKLKGFLASQSGV